MLRLTTISAHMTNIVPFNKFEEVFDTMVAEKKKAVILFSSDKN